MKALIPAAGLGARMLPVTKVVPKELLPIEGKPAIQWVLEEALSAGLREFVVVLSPRKAILRDFLTPIGEEDSLSSHRGLQELERLLHSVKIAFVEQPRPLGLGDAILQCRSLIGDEPFALLLPDNVFASDSLLLEQLIEVQRAYGKSCVGLWQAAGSHLRDGSVIADPYQGSLYNVRRVLPKGPCGDQSTGLRPVGRAVLLPAGFDHLKMEEAQGELTDVPLFDGLARDGSLLGLMVEENFHHIGVGVDYAQSAPSS